MIKSKAKVTVDEDDSKVIISIFPNISAQQRSILFFWIILWIILGVSMFIYLPQSSGDERVFVMVYLAFWAYFLFSSVKSMIWCVYGAEFLKLEDGQLSYKRSFKGYGGVIDYDLENIKQLGLIQHKENSFAKSYSETFWNIGGERLGFEYLGKKVAFGMKLTDKDAKAISKRVARAMQQEKS